MVRRTEQQWLQLFQQQTQSGLTARAFCLEHDINPAYFSKRKLELTAQVDRVPSESAFVRLQAPQVSDPTIRVCYQSTELHLPMNVDPQWFAQLIRSLTA